MGRKTCGDCDGCGQVADTANREPWSAWLALPGKSALAVASGMVKPIPCRTCDESGIVVELDVNRERAHLIAALAAEWASVMAYNDPDEPDWPVIYIQTETGQLSWHISPGDVDLFAHIPVVAGDDPRARWDGHSTEEKYERVEALVRVLTGPTPEELEARNANAQYDLDD